MRNCLQRQGKGWSVTSCLYTGVVSTSQLPCLKGKPLQQTCCFAISMCQTCSRSCSITKNFLRFMRLVEHTATKWLWGQSGLAAFLCESTCTPCKSPEALKMLFGYADAAMAALQAYWTATTWRNLVFQSISCRQSNSPTFTVKTIRKGGPCDSFQYWVHAFVSVMFVCEGRDIVYTLIVAVMYHI